MTEEEMFEIGIFEICQSLHMANHGASDPLPDSERDQLIAYLKKRVVEWRHPTRVVPWSHFDACVLALVLATIAETEREAGRL